MKSHNVFSIALIALSPHALSGTTESIKPTTVIKPQVQQSSSGCGSPNVIENSGRIQMRVLCQKITVLGQKTRMSSLEINQERLLLAQNPTELRITKAYLQPWLPDDQRTSLTLEFENPRNIPIPEIEIDFLDPESGASIPTLKPIPFTQSKVYREVGSHKFSLAAGAKTALPVAFLDEILGRQPLDPDLCAYDAALTLDKPLTEVHLDSLEQPHVGTIETQNRSLLVRARFKSIFQQQLSSTQWVWILYGKGSDGMQFWYPSEKRWGKLACVR
jgi:hypothetical protein